MRASHHKNEQAYGARCAHPLASVSVESVCGRGNALDNVDPAFDHLTARFQGVGDGLQFRLALEQKANHPLLRGASGVRWDAGLPDYVYSGSHVVGQELKRTQVNRRGPK